MNAQIVNSLLILISSFFVTYFLVPICIRVANQWNIKDFPNGLTKLQKNPTPYLGGVALYIGIFLPLAIFSYGDTQFLFVVLGSTVLFCIGLIDDLIVISPLQKLIGQFFATICFLGAGLYLKEHLYCNTQRIIMSLFWMLSLINAFNLVDIMDGLASTIAIGCALNFLILCLVLQQHSAITLLSAIIGSVLAFLYFNKPKALIYMGDAGSLLLGGLFSVLPFYFFWSKVSPLGILIPVAVLAIPILEVVGLIVMRTYKGIKFYKPSRDHFAHYLKSNGFNEIEILVIIFICALIISLITVLFAINTITEGCFLAMGSCCLIVWIKLFFFKIR